MWEEISAQEATAELLAAWIAKEELRPLAACARLRWRRLKVAIVPARVGRKAWSAPHGWAR
jgi:hypothetical protein